LLVFIGHVLFCPNEKYFLQIRLNCRISKHFQIGMCPADILVNKFDDFAVYFAFSNQVWLQLIVILPALSEFCQPMIAVMGNYFEKDSPSSASWACCFDITLSASISQSCYVEVAEESNFKAD
jgi:hypothetical protein